LNLVSSILRPIQAFRLAYLPLVMVYFAYGALGLIDVTRDLWIKEQLTSTPSELAAIGVWLTLPWTVKMVFGELVDCVPIFGSQRRVYILIGAAFTAAGLVILAGAAGGWLVSRAPIILCAGAPRDCDGHRHSGRGRDAMSTEVVRASMPMESRFPKKRSAPNSAWCRCSASRALDRHSRGRRPLGWIAAMFSREQGFLIGLLIPAISVTRRHADQIRTGRTPCDRLAHPRRRARIRRGGAALALAAFRSRRRSSSWCRWP
jgi:hypothetical protein